MLIDSQRIDDCPSSIRQDVSIEATVLATPIDYEFLASFVEEIDRLSFDGDVPENSWEYFLWRAQSEENARISCLLKLVAQEQFLRHWYLAAQTPNTEASATQGQLISAGHVLTGIDNRNRNWLGDQLVQYGWFTISEYGEDADVAAFLIVQHADDDVQFQRDVLEQLRPLADTGDTKPRRYAMLIDRVAVNSGELQIYGSQGYCAGPLSWEARPYEGTADEMNHRRQDVGLPDHQVYVDRMSRNCSTREY